jgi:Ca2+-binding EF-hand superfamily protein
MQASQSRGIERDPFGKGQQSLGRSYRAGGTANAGGAVGNVDLGERFRRYDARFGMQDGSSAPAAGSHEGRWHLARPSELEDAVRRIRQSLVQHGHNNLPFLVRKFRKHSSAPNALPQLDRTGFSNMLSQHCPDLSAADIDLGFKALDQDRDGSIKLPRLVGVLLGTLSRLRETMVSTMWQKLDRDCDGVLTYAELVRRFDAENHPDVSSGRRPAVQVLHDFVREFDGGTQDGYITKEEFHTYWLAQSMNIESDDEFGALIERLWKREARPAGQLRKTIGNMTAIETRDRAAAPKRGPAAAPIGALAANGLGIESCRKRQILVPRGSQNSGVNLGFSEGWSKEAFRTSKMRAGQFQGSAGNPMASPLERLRALVKQRGEDNMENGGFGRKFQAADKDHNRLLSREEFYLMLQRQGFACTDLEGEELWNIFDLDRSGCISYSEFLMTLRGNMNPFRRRLVDIAFSKFDKDSSGTVDIYDIRSRFNPAGAARVTNKSEYDSYKDFLIGFGDKNRDGKITRDEFQAYYDLISSHIDDDSYFELMMRNAWHVAGQGVLSSNTTNLRVLVAYEDGSEEVVALEDDFGLDLHSPNAFHEVVRRLESQGLVGIVDVEWMPR